MCTWVAPESPPVISIARIRFHLAAAAGRKKATHNVSQKQELSLPAPPHPMEHEPVPGPPGPGAPPLQTRLKSGQQSVRYKTHQSRDDESGTRAPLCLSVVPLN